MEKKFKILEIVGEITGCTDRNPWNTIIRLDVRYPTAPHDYLGFPLQLPLSGSRYASNYNLLIPRRPTECFCHRGFSKLSCYRALQGVRGISINYNKRESYKLIMNALISIDSSIDC